MGVDAQRCSRAGMAKDLRYRGQNCGQKNPCTVAFTGEYGFVAYASLADSAGSITVIRPKSPSRSWPDGGGVREPLHRMAEHAHLKMRDLR